VYPKNQKNLLFFLVKQTLLEQFINGVLLLLLWTYYNLSIAVFRVIQPCSENYMKQYPWIHCSGATYDTFISLGFVFFVLYVVGIPALLFALVVHVHRKDQLNDPFVVNTIGFLYMCYKSQSSWLFLVFIVRRVMISGIVAMVSGTIWINFTCVIVLLIFWGVIWFIQPFAKKKANHAQVVEVTVLIFTFIALETMPYSTPLYVCVAAVNAVPICWLLYLAFIMNDYYNTQQILDEDALKKNESDDVTMKKGKDGISVEKEEIRKRK